MKRAVWVVEYRPVPGGDWAPLSMWFARDSARKIARMWGQSVTRVRKYVPEK